MTNPNNRVLVALSGGVDSSVAAALLKEQGYAVEGAFIITWTAPWLPCTWQDERRDAMRVAAHLNIPFHTVDLSDEYEREVVQYLVREYKEGRTPNPDVMCNKHIKFGGFFDWAMEHGYDFVATGHYASVAHLERGTSPRVGGTAKAAPYPTDSRETLQRTTYCLRASADSNKDQTYFLWTLTQRHLAHTLFPVGGYTKPNVRTMAKTFDLPTATKKDSQGVCFLGKIDMQDFLRHYVPPETGNVLDEEGNRIGHHDGATYFTLGQRHGFTVHHTSPDTPKLYIVAKDATQNTITVAPRINEPTTRSDLHTQHIYLVDTNWISGTLPVASSTTPTIYTARLRYRQTLFPVTLSEVTPNSICVIPTYPQTYVPAGQSLVIYDGATCIGGGVIVYN